MNYGPVVEHMKKIASVLSVKINSDGSCGDICLEAANDLYLKSVNVSREDFRPGKPYTNYIPKDLNFEAMSYRCVLEQRMIHSYVNAEFYNAWMELYLMPMDSEDVDKKYFMFSYDMSPKVDANVLADISPDIASRVIRTTLKLRETDDFKKSIRGIMDDIRADCEANRGCILLTDFKARTCSVLCDSLSPDEHTPDMASYLDEGGYLINPAEDHSMKDDNSDIAFFDIVETWADLIAGSNCYIVHDANELEQMKDVSPIWYKSLKYAGVYSLVIYPLKANGETIGYIWVTNFNSDNTLNIKAILEVTSFILAAEISNHQLFKKLKILSDTDLLTGLLNRNAMNNRIADIVSGETPLNGNYGVAFVDLNGLKQVNDNEGHIAGDNLLKAAACVLREAFGEIDIFRVGGDEFLVLVDNCNEQDFNNLIASLREACEKSDTVKLAVGTCFGDKNVDVRKAMHIADERMYKDKEEYYKKYPELKYRNSK